MSPLPIKQDLLSFVVMALFLSIGLFWLGVIAS